MTRIGLLGLMVALATASTTLGCSNSVLGQNPGTAGAGGCASDLSGTWDVIATHPGSATYTWVVTINPTTFSMSSSSKTLLYTAGATKELTLTRPGRVVPVSVTNAPAAVNSGSIPLALGGSWLFAANGETCTVDVAAASAMGSCQGGGRYVDGGTGDWPYPLPSPMNGRTYSAARASWLPSQLGDLGGQWQLTNGAAANCTATVEGDRITATCTNAQPLTGSVQLTLGNDCVVSGTSGGYELSASRR